MPTLQGSNSSASVSAGPSATNTPFLNYSVSVSPSAYVSASPSVSASSSFSMASSMGNLTMTQTAIGLTGGLSEDNVTLPRVYLISIGATVGVLVLLFILNYIHLSNKYKKVKVAYMATRNPVIDAPGRSYVRNIMTTGLHRS